MQSGREFAFSIITIVIFVGAVTLLGAMDEIAMMVTVLAGTLGSVLQIAVLCTAGYFIMRLVFNHIENQRPTYNDNRQIHVHSSDASRITENPAWDLTQYEVGNGSNRFFDSGNTGDVYDERWRIEERR